MATVILANTTSRTQHVQNIVDLVHRRGFDGIDLDYEGFAFADGRGFVADHPAGVGRLRYRVGSGAARQRQAAVGDHPADVDGVGVLRGYPVYDPEAIGAVADRVRLMVYDWSVGSPGPISPMSWLNLVIAYNDPIVPNDKLQLGVPSYGRDWGRQAQRRRGLPRRGAEDHQHRAAEHAGADRRPRRDADARHISGEMTFPYDVVATGYRTTPIPAPPYVPPSARRPDGAAALPADAGGLQPALRLTPPTTQLSCTVRHFVYYPDAATIQQHAQAALDAGWSASCSGRSATRPPTSTGRWPTPRRNVVDTR